MAKTLSALDGCIRAKRYLIEVSNRRHDWLLEPSRTGTYIRLICLVLHVTVNSRGLRSPWVPKSPRAQGPGKALRPIEPVALHKKGAKVQQ